MISRDEIGTQLDRKFGFMAAGNPKVLGMSPPAVHLQRSQPDGELLTFEVAPRTVEEADQLLALVREEIARIDEQLGDDERRDQYPTIEAYALWRRRAIRAKHAKQREITKLTIWRKGRHARNTAHDAGITDADDPTDILRAVVGVLRGLAREDDFEFTEDEQRVVDVATNYLQRC